jgi:hydroxyacylglutathione hydrolase
MISASPLLAFNDNYIWLIHGSDSKHVAIVDPGDATPVLKLLQQDGLTPVAILITHHHGDHVGGVTELLSHYDIPVYGPAREQIPGITHPLQGGETITLSLDAENDTHFRVMFVPGHTAGHIAYFGHGMLFCGDTLFTAGCGRLFEGSAEQMHAAMEQIAALPDETGIYCAHEYTLDNLVFARVVEPESPALLRRIDDCHRLRDQGLPTVPAPLALEKATNPFLRYNVPHVIDAAEKFSGKPLQRGSGVFGTLRYWKDTLD